MYKKMKIVVFTGLFSVMGSGVDARIINFDDIVNPNDVVGSFRNAVENLSKTALVVVDFWTKPCPTCKRLNPAFDQLNSAHGDRVVIIKLFVKKYLRNFAHASFYPNTGKVAKVPRILIFKAGAKVDDFMAERPSDLISKVNSHLG